MSLCHFIQDKKKWEGILGVVKSKSKAVDVSKNRVCSNEQAVQSLKHSGGSKDGWKISVGAGSYPAGSYLSFSRFGLNSISDGFLLEGVQQQNEVITCLFDSI